MMGGQSRISRKESRNLGLLWSSMFLLTVRLFYLWKWVELTAVRDEQTLQDYFDYYIKLHRMRKGEATAMDMIVPPAITGTRPSTESGRHFLLYPGALVHKFHTSRRNLGLPPVAPSMEKGGSSGDGCAMMNDNENASSEVDEVILVRKLGSIFSLRDRRTKVLRQLEMVRIYQLRG